MSRILVALCGLVALAAAAGAAPPAEFASGRLDFAVGFAGEVGRYQVLAGFVLPGQKVEFEIVEGASGGPFGFAGPGGEWLSRAPREATWVAPREPGLYPVTVTRAADGVDMLLNIFVLVPMAEVADGWLNGYRIGEYPDKPLRGLTAYLPPAGFVEVTPEVIDTRVSPHFTLRQFLCKQESGYPKYLVLKTRLLRKLEVVLQRINAAGIRADDVVVMSGYRTPWYNRAIGNVKYSRHVWGGAADIYLDSNPRDGQMDDLNGDGKSNVEDANMLYRIIDTAAGRESWAPFVGGLGQYRRTAAHGPFVHVDVRGFRARWGD